MKIYLPLFVATSLESSSLAKALQSLIAFEDPQLFRSFEIHSSGLRFFKEIWIYQMSLNAIIDYTLCFFGQNPHYIFYFEKTPRSDLSMSLVVKSFLRPTADFRMYCFPIT